MRSNCLSIKLANLKKENVAFFRYVLTLCVFVSWLTSNKYMKMKNPRAVRAKFEILFLWSLSM